MFSIQAIEGAEVQNSYVYSCWTFKRALGLVYMIAFASLATQALGLFGQHGILPISDYLHSLTASGSNNWISLILDTPSLFWISSSDGILVGASWLGFLAGALAFLGIAEGWMFLLSFALYLSFCSAGQKFMRFQGDHLLLEVGFLVLFVASWDIASSFFKAKEPRKAIRYLFYLVIFKLMFLSGLSKLLSGDSTWRDLTALSYHYWTQPLPNPLSPFVYALPLWVHRFSTFIMFIIELGLPFLTLWPRARVFAFVGFTALSLMITTTGNFMFFNWLTIFLCFYLLPDKFWQRLYRRLRLQITPESKRSSPGILAFAFVMALISVLWISRRAQPSWLENRLAPVYSVTKSLGMSYSYALFPTMTTTRPEIIIEGSQDGKTWKEYEFYYQPGPLNRRPPVIEPFHPRLDWEMWFAGPATYHPNPWFDHLMMRVLEGSPEVLAFFSQNPFQGNPPHYLRAVRYEYKFTSSGEILRGGNWWTRKYVGEFSPVYQSSSAHLL